MSARSLLPAFLVCFVLAFGLTTATAPHGRDLRPHCVEDGSVQQPVADAKRSAFSSLLSSTSAKSLHEILVECFPGRYQQGVYESDHSAMEAVHRGNAALATSLVQMAKRQDGQNATDTTASTTSTSASSDPTLTAATTTTTPTSTGTTAVPPPPSSSSLSAADTTTSNAPPPVSTNSNLPPTTSQGEAATSTPAEPTPSSSASDSLGGTTLTTTKASSSKSSQTTRLVTSTFTSTLPGGGVTVVTATSWVAAEGGSGDAPTSTRPDATLQTNGAVARNRGVIIEAVVGAMIGGVVLL